MPSYTIKSGDTLGDIAYNNKTTSNEILRLNPQITNPNLIQAGANINLPGGVTDAQFNSLVSILGGQTPTPPSTITSDSLRQVNTPNYQTPTTPPPVAVPKTSGIPEVTYAPTAQEQEISRTLGEVRGLLSQTGGEADYRRTQEEEQGLMAKRENLQKIQDRLNALNAQASVQDNRIENRQLPEFAIVGEQAALERSRASQALVISAQFEAAKGNLALAEDYVDRAVSAKFDPIKEQIDIKLKNIQLLKDDPETSRQDKKRALETEAKLNSELQQIEDAKTEESAKWEILTLAASQGGDSATLRRIEQAQTKEEALRIAQPFLATKNIVFRELENGQTIAINSATGEVIENYGGAKTGTVSGGGSSSGTYANDLDAIVGTVLSTIPSKFGQQTFNQQIENARDDADKINLVAAQVLKGQPAEFKNDFRNQAVGISQLDKAIAELDKGVQTGVLNNAKQYAYNIFGKDFDPKLAAINGYITSAIQPYRNSVTGAAWGEQEDTEYQQLFGSTKYSPAELRQRLVQTKELLKSKSAEGLNSFVNPLGYYDNQFDTGSLAPQISTDTANTTAQTSSGGGFWSKVGSFLFGDD